MAKEFSEDDIRAVPPQEHVRLRPDLYFKKCFDEQSLDSLPLEVACHALDEYFDGKCKQLEIVLHKDFFAIKYDAGMSLDTSHGAHTAELLMTSIFACRNHKKHLAVGQEFCELGIATINYASRQLELTTASAGQKGHFLFEEGWPKSRQVEATQESEHTEIKVWPDKAIFGGLGFSYGGVNTKVKQLNAKLDGLQILVKHESL